MISARQLAQFKAYRLRNREKRNAQKREWAKRNRWRVAEYQKQWISKQPDRYWDRWPSRPQRRQRKPGRSYAQTLEANRVLRAKNRKQLSDSYLRGWMSRTTGYTIKPNEWPADLVEAKRAQLKIKRLCRKLRTTTNSETICSTLMNCSNQTRAD